MTKTALISWIRKIGDSIESYDRISKASEMGRYFVNPNIAGILAGTTYYVSQIETTFKDALGQFKIDPVLIWVFILIEGISLLAHFGAGLWHGMLWARVLSWFTRSFLYVILLSAGAVLTSVIAIDDPALAKSIIVYMVVVYGIIEIFRYALLTMAGSEPKRLAWIRTVKTTLATALSFEALSIRELRERAHDSVDSIADEADEKERLAHPNRQQEPTTYPPAGGAEYP